MWRDWEETSLNECISMIRNGLTATQTGERTSYPVTRIETISDGTINFDKVGYINKANDQYKLQHGDILYSNINSIDHVGKTALYNGEHDLYHGMNLLLLRPNGKVFTPYLFYILNSSQARNYAQVEAKKAVNQVSLGQKEICAFKFKAPVELNEQKAIAEVLDTVDEAIAATQAMLDKQDKIKDGLLQDLLTRGVDANGKLRNKKQSLNGTLSDVVNLVNHKIAIGKNPDLPYIGLEHLDKRTLHISRHGNALDSVSTNNVFSPNDILFGKLRPNLKKCALAETHGYCSTDILVLRANTNINPLFALYICSSEPIFYEAIKSTEGTKMPRTSWAAIKDVPVYLPDTEEQNLIVAVMDSHLKKKRDTENELNKLKKLKAGLMQDLLTGKKRISKNQREAA
jgi:type I restriction enzyme S subunit